MKKFLSIIIVVMSLVLFVFSSNYENIIAQTESQEMTPYDEVTEYDSEKMVTKEVNVGDYTLDGPTCTGDVCTASVSTYSNK